MKQINERYNIVKKPVECWDKLVDLILEYIYDAKGLHNDIEILIDDPEITLSMLKQFYLNTHNTFRFPDDIIPAWIKNFSIEINDSNDSFSGWLKLKSVTYDEDTEKLTFGICLNYDWSNPKTLNNVAKILMHEFRHAYSAWLYYKYDFHVMTDLELYTYGEYMKLTEKTPKLDRRYNKYFQTVSLFYMINQDEVRANLEGYKKEVCLMLKDNTDNIREEMKTVRNIQDIKCVGYADIHEYFVYKYKYDFTCQMIDDLKDRSLSLETLTDLVSGGELRNILNAYMFSDNKKAKEENDKAVDWNINIIYQTADDEGNEYIKEKHQSTYDSLAGMLIKVLKKLGPKFKKVIDTMKDIYYEELYKVCAELK